MFDWQTKRVIVVDRDEQFRFWARGVFRNQRARDVLTLHDPAEARVVLSHQHVDVGLIDLEKGDVEALTLIRWLRERKVGSSSNLPLLVVVKAMDRDLINQACAFGIHGVLRKPISAELLLKTVANTISRPRLVGGSLPHISRTASSPAADKKPTEAGRPRPAAPRPAVSGAPAAFPRETVEAGAGVAAAPLREGKEAAASPPAVSRAPVEVAGGGDGSPRPMRDLPLDDLPGAGKAKAGRVEPAGVGKVPGRSDPMETVPPTARATPPVQPAGPDIEAILAGHARWVDSGGADGQRARLDAADLSGRNLAGAQLTSALLPRADLSGCDLTEAHLHGADLRNADLTGSRLSGANLAVSRLRHAHLRACLLNGANLKGADLAGADLSGAQMSDADLHGAILLGVDLSAADLSGVSGLSQGQLERARGDAKTRLPPGLFLPATED